MEATLQEILDAREARASQQQALLKEYGKPLLCFTMNIPGPVKLDRDVSIGFFVGCQLLRDTLPKSRLLYIREERKNTGCEGYYVVDMPAADLKKLAVELEDSSAVGRLFDFDVLDTDGTKLSRESMGYPRRQCLLCDQAAVICASQRTHTVEQLREKTDFLLYLAARQYMAEFIAVRAYLALMQEVNTTPKPGLVDRNNRGAHPDMSVRLFLASAIALRPYFCRFAEIGYLDRDLPHKEAFHKLRELGKEAEQAMFTATGGINTHKGAVFSLGLLCAAAGRLSPENWQAENILAEAAQLAAGVTGADFADVTPENAKTAGQWLYATYGVTGIRGEAEKGFPAVKNVGLPTLKSLLQQGRSLNDAGAVTLLHLLTVTEDTNLIHRSDLQTLQAVQQRVKDLLQEDITTAQIEELDREFIEKNLSPGGSADLLSATFFLFFLGA